MNFPGHLKYTKTHEWVKVEGETAVCGITDYAQKEISDVVFVEVPKKGKQVKQGDPAAVVESVKAAFDIYAPVSGEVMESNQALEGTPALVNQDPYGEGWFFKVKLSQMSELNSLLSSAVYEKYIQEGAHSA
jgi:glycine cleavage system H protein